MLYIAETNDYWKDALLWRKNNFSGKKKWKIKTKKMESPSK